MNKNALTERANGEFRLDDIDLTKRAKRKTYDGQLKELQYALQRIQQAYLHSKDRAIIVFEGWDAAGKGGTIRRLSASMDPRSFKVWPIGAPRPYYKRRHYLHRFWERLPPEGAIAVFDRSWYGRVLVERVEGFADANEWSRAFDEINEFERLLVDDGARLVKLFLHISPDVQRKRFLERLDDPAKRWKLSHEDFRNREKWHHYSEAIEEMVQRTSTVTAPWRVVPANDKKHARLEALEIVRCALSEGIDLTPRPAEDGIEELARNMTPHVART